MVDGCYEGVTRVLEEEECLMRPRACFGEAEIRMGYKWGQRQRVQRDDEPNQSCEKGRSN